MQCVSTVKDGWLVDIDTDCGAVTASPGLCPTEFISAESQYGVKLPARSVLLGENTKCTIMLDATAATARVTFDGTNSLGVMYPGYVIGTPITINQGDVKYVTVYNGMSKGSVQFQVTFSGAASLAVSSLAALASIAYVF